MKTSVLLVQALTNNLVELDGMEYVSTNWDVTTLKLKKGERVSLHSKTVERVLEASSWFTVDGDGIVTIIWK